MSLSLRRLQLLEQLSEKQAARDSITAQLENPRNPARADPDWVVRSSDARRHLLREIRGISIELTRVNASLQDAGSAQHRALLRCALAADGGTDEEFDAAFDHLDTVFPRWREIATRLREDR